MNQKNLAKKVRELERTNLNLRRMLELMESNKSNTAGQGLDLALKNSYNLNRTTTEFPLGLPT